ncbi:MAG: IS4 family transposase [Tannerella sp.]|jgi:hypothetical protein|nr:IS4 family transposase [Tannerella sp.]
MPLFKNHTLPLSELLKLIPDPLFVQIAKDTGVDYYAKVLTGKMMFNLLFFAMLTMERTGQRGLADLFSSPQFRMLFPVKKGKTRLSHSSISERLSEMNVDFFREVYECIRVRFSEVYPAQSIGGVLLQRVDSTLVAETSGKLKEGMTCGNEYKKKKMLKFTLNYDRTYGSCVSTHTQEKYASESLALPENVIKHFRKCPDHASVYLIDRGQSSTSAFDEMNSHEGLRFVGRLQENRRLLRVKTRDTSFKRFGDGILKEDALVKLYKREESTDKTGKRVGKQVLTETVYRVIRFRPPDSDNDIILISNIFNVRAEQIAQWYRRRWDIEVFFRFLKQELNFSHFVSLNENGIQIVLYMTLIVAMLIRIYKKENDIGYKTAKRRMEMELQEIILAIAVVRSGGDLNRISLPAP